MQPNPLVRTAWHESGHAVAAHRLGGTIKGAVSIVPTKQWRGVAFVSGPGARQHTMPGLGRALKRAAVVSLAGRAAERWAPPGLPEPPPPSSPLPPPTSAEQLRLAKGDEDEATPNDLENAFHAVELLVDGDPLAMHQLVARLERCAARLLATPAAQAQLYELAAALLAYRTLSARAVTYLLNHTPTKEEVPAA